MISVNINSSKDDLIHGNGKVISDEDVNWYIFELYGKKEVRKNGEVNIIEAIFLKKTNNVQ